MKLHIMENTGRIRKSVKATGVPERSSRSNARFAKDYFKVPIAELCRQIQKISEYPIDSSYPSYSREGSAYTGINLQIKAGYSSLVEVSINLDTNVVTLYTIPTAYTDEEFMALQKKAVDIIANNVKQ